MGRPIRVTEEQADDIVRLYQRHHSLKLIRDKYQVSDRWLYRFLKQRGIPSGSTKIDLTGQRFGRWFVIKAGDSRKRQTMWECKCDCGSQTLVATGNLRSGKTMSCGCLARELASVRKTTHGKTQSAEYIVWCLMKSRCLNPSDAAYLNYGGRGISVCERWRLSFEAFLFDMGERPKDGEWQIDRIDNDKSYACGSASCQDCQQNGITRPNCRWTSRSENLRHTRHNRLLEYNGEKKCLVEWAEITGLPASAIIARIDKLGWAVEKALTTPLRKRRA